MDLTKFAEPKSDQLNADDLIGGNLIVQIAGVTIDEAASKVNVHIEGRRPWRPCKTTLRQLFAAWGTDGEKWIGRWVELKRDPTVRFGGEDVGGIRIHALSHIPKPMDDKLTIAKGKKGAFRVEVLKPPTAKAADPDPILTALRLACVDATKRGWTMDQVHAIMGATKGADVPPDQREAVTERLKGDPPSAESEPPTDDTNPADSPT